MNQYIANLQQRHDTVGPYYLSDFYKPDGSKRLHDFLTSVYQPVYENNFRIIIVQDCVDMYDYQDLPGNAITALQKYASQIDISNFFIVVVTGNENIKTELEQARQLYSTDDFQIQSEYVKDIKYNKEEQPKQNTFCILPWMHLYVGPDGNVLPCCAADQKYPMGSTSKNSVDSILKSTAFNQLRKNMLDGKRSKECSRCYAQEDAGLQSLRQLHNARWSKESIKFNTTGTIEEFAPVFLDIRLNNICNLKCRMCSGYFSSAIAQEEATLFNNQEYLDTAIGSTQKALVLEEIIQYLPYAKKIYFAGGEPLITAEHYKILDALVTCNNTNLEIFYNTNFTSLVYKGTSIVDIWKKFTNITVGASLDAMGAVAEYVRHGTKWETIESNLALLKSHCPHVKFTVTSVAGLLNVSSLIELQKSWHENQTLDISKFTVTTMVGPEQLTLQVLPDKQKMQVSEKIKAHIKWCKQHRALTLAKQWSNVLKYMYAADSSHLLPKFKQLTKAMDQFRNESLSSVLPEFLEFYDNKTTVEDL
jgi:radical SAM protein with 4Fe4S-binding SPASM domain